MENADIRLYTLSTCSHCSRTKRFFQDSGINVRFVDVDLLTGEERSKMLDEVRRLNPDCTFPTIAVNGAVIIGYNEKKLRSALGLE